MDSDDEAGCEYAAIDSRDEGCSSLSAQGRDRSTTLASPPPHLTSTSGLKLKLSSSHPNAKGRPQTHANMDASPTPSGSTAAASAAVGSSIDFSLPSQPARPLVPPRPGVQKPFKPGPKRQSEVNDDYSNTKAPNQVLFTSFWSGLEPYLRDIGEDDLAMLGFKVGSGRQSSCWVEADAVSRPTHPNHTRCRQGEDIIPRSGMKKMVYHQVQVLVCPFPTSVNRRRHHHMADCRCHTSYRLWRCETKRWWTIIVAWVI